MKLLLVEDEPKLAEGIAKALQQRGYAVDCAYEGEKGENMARMNNYDLIILDIMLPKRDGLTLCRNLRASGNVVPVLFLTAKDATSDKVLGLDEGGDDYMVKPFAFSELEARVRTLLRRPPLSNSDQLMLDDLVLDTKSQRLVCQGTEIGLTLREYAFIEYLLRNVGTVLTREDIVDHVWDHTFDSFSNVIDVHLKNLRKKLPSHYAKRIQTIRGKGYRLA